MSSAYRPHHMIRVTSGMRQDALVLLKFIHSFNETCPFPDQSWSLDTDLEFFTDSAKLTGGGVYFHGEGLTSHGPNIGTQPLGKIYPT